MTRVTPSAEPPRDGLTTSGQPEPVDDRVEDLARAELAEQRLRERHEVRRREAGARGDGLGDRLAPGDAGSRAARCRGGAGRAAGRRRARSRPRRWSPCSSGQTRSGCSCDERGDQVGVDVVHADVAPRRSAARRRPGGRSAGTRRARGRGRRRGRRRGATDVVVTVDRLRGRRGESAAERTSRRVETHGGIGSGARQGAGDCDVVGPGREPPVVPNSSTSSRSPSTTPASRRTPSRMRSGVG